MSKPSKFRAHLLATLVCAAVGGICLPSTAIAAEADLIKRIDALQAEIDALKAQVMKAQSDAAKAQAEATKAQAAAPAKAADGKPVATSNTDGITVYGRLELTLENNDDGKVTRQVMQSHSSRIGFKGQRKFGDGLTGLLQIETGIAPDDHANSSAFANRDSYAGLRHDRFGTLLYGRHDSPFKDLEGTASLIWGSGEAMEIIIHGKGTSRAAGSTWVNLHTRMANSLQYFTPKFGHVSGRLAYAPDEVNGATGTVRKPIYGGSVEYDDGQFNAGLAYENQVRFNGAGKDFTGMKLTMGYEQGPIKAGMAFSRLDNDAGKKTSNWMIVGSYKTGPVVLKANYGASSQTATGAADGLKMVAFEVDYPLDKFTALYGYYTKIANDRNARGRFESGENKYTPVAGDDPSALGFGIRYNF